MNAERRTRLEEAGIDVGEALERMLGSEALLERLLGKFPADPNFAALGEALAEGDAQRAVAAAHTLKGVCANLSMTGAPQPLHPAGGGPARRRHVRGRATDGADSPRHGGGDSRHRRRRWRALSAAAGAD